jgi:hypothetical protein
MWRRTVSRFRRFGFRLDPADPGIASSARPPTTASGLVLRLGAAAWCCAMPGSAEVQQLHHPATLAPAVEAATSVLQEHPPSGLRPASEPGRSSWIKSWGLSFPAAAALQARRASANRPAAPPA